MPAACARTHTACILSLTLHLFALFVAMAGPATGAWCSATTHGRRRFGAKVPWCRYAWSTGGCAPVCRPLERRCNALGVYATKLRATNSSAYTTRSRCCCYHCCCCCCCCAPCTQLGRFPCPIEAAHVWDGASDELRGPSGTVLGNHQNNCNFPEDRPGATGGRACWAAARARGAAAVRMRRGAMHSRDREKNKERAAAAAPPAPTPANVKRKRAGARACVPSVAVLEAWETAGAAASRKRRQWKDEDCNASNGLGSSANREGGMEPAAPCLVDHSSTDHVQLPPLNSLQQQEQQPGWQEEQEQEQQEEQHRLRRLAQIQMQIDHERHNIMLTLEQQSWQQPSPPPLPQPHMLLQAGQEPPPQPQPQPQPQPHILLQAGHQPLPAGAAMLPSPPRLTVVPPMAVTARARARKVRCCTARQPYSRMLLHCTGRAFLLTPPPVPPSHPSAGKAAGCV